MLQQAADRLAPLVPPERVLVGTGREYVETVLDQLPGVRPDNVLGEPVGRDTAAAIGLGATHLRRQDPDAVMAVVTADHAIARPDVLRGAIQSGARLAEDGWLVTLGIRPTYPETGYGYVERGEPIRSAGGSEIEAFRVARFVEKPSRERAEEYLRTDRFSWNSGMFVWRADRILEEMARRMPELAAGLAEIERSLGTPEAASTFDRVWPTLPRKSIDFGVMEKAERVAVIPVDLGWSDVGHWSAVYDVLPKDARGNAVVGEHFSEDTSGTLVYAPGRLVATIGLEDLIVVDSGDVLLICPRSRAQDVKQLVSRLQEQNRKELL
jgi:mannose-1-phosphate guanylyltransferase